MPVMTKERNRLFFRILTTVLFAGLLIVPAYLSSYNKNAVVANHRIAKEMAINKYGFYLQDASAESHVNFIHHAPQLDPKINPILPQIASVGASVSVCDFDKDGWNDFYVTNSCFGFRNALYHNMHDGTFEDVAEQMGVADLNIEGQGVSMGSVWADFDNDGFDDLLVYKWGRPRLFRNDSGKRFIDVTEKAGLPKWINSNCAIWFDYNSDGLPDLFIAGYYREDVDLWHLKTTRILTESFEYSQNGGRSYLFKNMGNGTFKDVSEEVGLTSTRWTFAAGAADLNGDGYPELFIANDYGISELYFNEGGKRFVEKGKSLLVGLAPKSGMNVSFGDTYNKGQFGIYVSNITEQGILLQGNNFWVPYPGKNKQVYLNDASSCGIENGGWSYGAQFADLNNDGYQDLYVANGYISAKKGTSYWYDYSKVTGGNEAIISDVKNWSDMKGRSQSGYQQNKIWMNKGNGMFEDVSNFAADTEFLDGRSVAVADLWNRGVLDVLVANQKNKLMIYKNNVNPLNHWIDFELQGTKSNLDAIGSIVELHWDGKMQYQLVTAGIGFSSQNQHRLHFGLGRNPRLEKAIIHWPDGHKQEITALQTDRINHITE